MSRAVFIAGTDTGVGKTHVSTQLLLAAAAQHLRTRALKPIAAGAEPSDEKQPRLAWQNDDALRLAKVANSQQSYDDINPFCFPDPVSPHIAAARVGHALSVDAVAAACQQQLLSTYDFALVEGAGGWRVPISDDETMADLAKVLALPVILVVGLRLGCINHALLTAEAMLADGVRVCGWIANECEPTMMARDENIATLVRRLPFPMLAHLPFSASSVENASSGLLDIHKIMQAMKN